MVKLLIYTALKLIISIIFVMARRGEDLRGNFITKYFNLKFNDVINNIGIPVEYGENFLSINIASLSILFEIDKEKKWFSNYFQSFTALFFECARNSLLYTTVINKLKSKDGFVNIKKVITVGRAWKNGDSIDYNYTTPGKGALDAILALVTIGNENCMQYIQKRNNFITHKNKDGSPLTQNQQILISNQDVQFYRTLCKLAYLKESVPESLYTQEHLVNMFDKSTPILLNLNNSIDLVDIAYLKCTMQKKILTYFSAELVKIIPKIIKQYGQFSETVKHLFINGLKLGENNYWYSYADIIQGLSFLDLQDHQLGIIGSEAQLRNELIRLQNNPLQNNFQVMIMNVNAQNGSFDNNNHWVGVFIDRRNNQNRIIYIDPRGTECNDSIKQLLTNQLRINEITNLFDAKHRPQTDGNHNDCGPFVVEAIRQLTLDQNLNNIRTTMMQTEQTSSQYGQQLQLQQSGQTNADNQEITTSLNTTQPTFSTLIKINVKTMAFPRIR